MQKEIIVKKESILQNESDYFNSEDSVDFAVQRAEKQVQILNRVLAIAVKRTNERDWVDMGGKPYPCGSGAEKLMALFGLSVTEISKEKSVSKDDIGEYYIYEYKGTFSWKGGIIEAIGTCSSRDKFFAYNSQLQSYKPHSEVDETNIMKSSYTNMLVNGVTRLLGIRNLTWAQLEKMGIERGKISKVEYKSKGAPATKEEKNLQIELANMLLGLNYNNKELASRDLLKLTSFKGKNGKEVKGKTSPKELKGNWLKNTHNKVKIMYDKLQKEITHV